jgi:hypothetical protein
MEVEADKRKLIIPPEEFSIKPRTKSIKRQFLVRSAGLQFYLANSKKSEHACL